MDQERIVWPLIIIINAKSNNVLKREGKYARCIVDQERRFKLRVMKKAILTQEQKEKEEILN